MSLPENVDVDLLRIEPSTVELRSVDRSTTVPRHSQGERFLKGPIPHDWLTRASTLPGKSLHVGMVIWYLVGISKVNEAKISGKVLREYGVGRKSMYRSLRALASAGLVQVIDQRRGASPIVKLLPAPKGNRPTTGACPPQ